MAFLLLEFAPVSDAFDAVEASCICPFSNCERVLSGGLPAVRLVLVLMFEAGAGNSSSAGEGLGGSRLRFLLRIEICAVGMADAGAACRGGQGAVVGGGGYR